MRARPILFAFLAGLAGLLATGAGFLACSSGGNATQIGGIDASTDTGGGITVFDTSTGDTGTGLPDGKGSGFDGGNGGDSGHRDGNVGDAFTIDAPGGHCSLVTGACDIVSQNCSAGNECALVGEPDGSLGTACEPTTASEHIPKGAGCCPTSDGTNPCAPGLECNGGNACADGGTPSNAGWGFARCTPRCCPALDGGDNNANCGTAGDGGAAGQCSLNITFVDNGPTEYSVCIYPPPCEAFVTPCQSGFTCEVENAAGTSSCVDIFNPAGEGGTGNGATSGEACMYANSCADGLGCFGATATMSTCQWLCRVPSAEPPFDAGVLNSMPGHGGCPSGQTCEQIDGPDGGLAFPAWLGGCFN